MFIDSILLRKYSNSHEELMLIVSLWCEFEQQSSYSFERKMMALSAKDRDFIESHVLCSTLAVNAYVSLMAFTVIVVIGYDAHESGRSESAGMAFSLGFVLISVFFVLMIMLNKAGKQCDELPAQLDDQKGEKSMISPESAN